MSEQSFIPDLTVNESPFNNRPAPRWGERAEEIRAISLDYPELSHRQIAKRVGCHPSNVDQVLERFLGRHSVRELKDFQENKAEIFDSLQLRTLGSITDAHLANASLQQLVTSAAILEDKARLVRGQATSIHVTALLDVADMIRNNDKRNQAQLLASELQVEHGDAEVK